MPFKSKSQLRKFAKLVKLGQMSRKTFKEWLNNTASVDSLPEKVKPKKTNRVTKVRVLK